MARSEITLPPAPRPNIDVFGLSNALAAPEVARQQARALRYQALSQLPQDIFGFMQGLQEYRTKQAREAQDKALMPLELEAKRQAIAESKAREEERLARAKSFGTEQPIYDPATGEILYTVPKGARTQRQKPQSFVPGEKQLQQDIKGLDENLNLMFEIQGKAEKYKNAFGSFDPRAGSDVAARYAEELNLVPEGWNAFRADVKDYFNRYRKWATGVQASFPELKFMETTVPVAKAPRPLP